MTLNIWVFVYHSQNAILSKLFKLIKCQNFDTQSFVTDHLSQYCDATQLKLSYYVFAPLYILSLLIPQTLFLYKLHQRRYFLKNYKNIIIYGFFAQEYKQKFFFWDQVKLTYKTILGIIAMFSYQFNQLQPVLSIIASLTYSLFLLICKYLFYFNLIIFLFNSQFYLFFKFRLALQKELTQLN
ncbi:transmembrane protein, putative (macronuclear) [Tetrahymena thermophila SB210]|uniref:Transmembrane protein, putative n=1 Tax=Tetrahymena thermophila (strain SB210) TaxID=312017 RepID=W7XEG5_TETTS|nr:transmembrane protein, putative [Tetrahymena thermophila SB210]EWS71279.1 transmembrane protein, putative [Tetrahymena thermophila SB210]|eukprot:XP_012656185.1 transmembrane protein, putative [Tetrahymena thermophila SB210]